MARGMFNFQDNYDWDREQEVDGDTLGTRFDPRSVDYGTIPSDLIRDEIAETAFIRDFVTKFKDKLEGKDPSEYSEWIRVLGDYATGNAELSDLEAVDVSGLMDVEGFKDYYYGVVPRPLKETKTLQDYIDEFGEDVVNTAQGIYDDVGGFIEGAKDDPLGTLVSILDVVVDAGIPEKCQDLKDCKTANPDKGTYCWKDCVNFSVLAGIPGLPNLPGMQDVGTYRDFEDAVKEIGTTIGDVIEGNANCGENNDQDCTVSQVLTDAGTWVMEKIEGVLKDIDDASIDDAYDWIKGIFGAAVGGFVFTQVKEEIEDIFFPFAPPDDSLINCADYGREGGEVESVDECGNCLNKTEDIGTDGRCRKFIKDDFDVSEVETTCKREGKEYNDLLDECGGCIQEGYVPGADGVCGPIDGDVDTEVDPRCSDPAFAARNPSLCGGQTTYTEGPGFGKTKCQDRYAENYDQFGECGDCIEGYSRKTEGSNCTKDETTGTVDVGDDTTEVYDPDCETDPKPTGPVTFDLISKQKIWEQKCGTGGGGGGGTECPAKGTVIESGCDGTTFFARYADGECGEIYDSIPGYAGCGGGYECDDPNATVREDGSCGPCKAGYVYDGAVERCVQESVPNPCLDSDYAVANPEECGTDPDCVDCTCAEYAAANPDECGTAPPPPETPSGGGFGGGGAGGMFSVDAGFELSGDPQLLTKMQFPIENFLQQYVQGMGDQNTSITSLFEGLV